MEQIANTLAPETATDEPASSFDTRPDFAAPPLLSDCLDDTLAETFPPGHRKPRHDGWTPEAVAGFLHDLAAHGVVEHAARAVGLSAASAYAFRNRRQGRAFAQMWDAMLVHRARARIASELQARAIAGCVSVRKRDGVVVGEYHYYDNRLAMALLTRLDRLAEREAPAEAHLRTLSEDLDDYLDCLAEGGDADAFVAARRPAEPVPEEAPPRRHDDDPQLTTFAHLSGCDDYRDVSPLDIEVRDLDPRLRDDWEPDQLVRACRSGFMIWLEMKASDPGFSPGPGTALRYHVARLAAQMAADAAETGARGAAVPVDDLDPAMIADWTDDQLARAWRSGLLRRLPNDFWDDLAWGATPDGAEG